MSKICPFWLASPTLKEIQKRLGKNMNTGNSILTGAGLKLMVTGKSKALTPRHPAKEEKRPIVGKETIGEIISQVKENWHYPRKMYRFETLSQKWSSYGIGMKSISTPTEAVLDLFKKETVMDCERTALSIVYRLLLEKVGQEKFNSLFPEGLRVNSCFNFKSVPRDLAHVLEMKQLKWFKDLEVGDWTYIQSDPDYFETNRGGSASGEHVVVVSTDPLLFVGLTNSTQSMAYEDWLEMLFKSAKGISRENIKGIIRHDGNILVRRIKADL